MSRVARVPLTMVLVLTFATGVVDAVSYVSLEHVFTANMSGNMALLGIGAATSIGDVAGNLFAFCGFVTGSVLAGRLFRRRQGPALRDAVGALGVEVALLLVATAIVAATSTAAHDAWRFAVCAVLAAAMGIQTGVARRLAVQDVNTTVATMTLHDLAAASRAAGGASERWVRRVAVVVGLFAGAALGVTLDGAVRWGGLALTSALVLAVAVYGGYAGRTEARLAKGSHI